jgi:hypothetical protein
MEEPQGFGTSPYQLRKGGKPSQAVVEGLGGSPGTETAVGNALAWLAAHQEPDGHWDTAKYGGAAGHNNAITGFALLAFLGAGIQHDQPGAKYQPVVAKAIEWLVAQTKPDGDVRGQGGTMYDQGIASAAIAEAYGLSKDQKLAATVSNVTSFIVKAQNKESGGWRYAPGDRGDTSVFGWQIMALKSAELAGIKVPASTYELADKWLLSVAAGEKGGLYGYESKNATPAMTAEGMFCHQLMGDRPDDPRLQESAGYVGANIPDSKAVDIYYWYYGTLAMYQLHGPAWEVWNERMKEGLLATQVKDGADAGSWTPVGQWGAPCGRAGFTAMSALILEVYYRYLPMYSSSQPKSSAPAKPAPKK